MIRMTPPNNRTLSPRSDRDRSLPWWSVTGTLLGFLCLSHLLVMTCFAIGWRVTPLIAPAAFVLSLVAGDRLSRQTDTTSSYRLLVPTVTLAIVGISLLLARAFFDMSWDGLWYHQTAVYQMAAGWNPLSDPMHNFVPH